MQQPTPKAAFDAEREYRAIEATLLESARGRWFLAEHGRRARRLDSALLEEAIGRLQNSLRQPPALLGQLQFEIEGLKAFVAETRMALVARSVPAAAPSRADGQPQSATTGIIKAAEDMHEAAWRLQAHEIDPQNCEAIARNAAQIYALAQQQAVESQRALMLADALEQALTRLSGLAETIAHEMQIDGDQAAAAASGT